MFHRSQSLGVEAAAHKCLSYTFSALKRRGLPRKAGSLMLPLAQHVFDLDHPYSNHRRKHKHDLRDTTLHDIALRCIA